MVQHDGQLGLKAARLRPTRVVGRDGQCVYVTMDGIQDTVLVPEEIFRSAFRTSRHLLDEFTRAAGERPKRAARTQIKLEPGAQADRDKLRSLRRRPVLSYKE
jgi:hypothetical protein